MGSYYADDTVTLYHGDMREVVPALGIAPDCVVTDPPYGETALTWDRWPDGWPGLVAALSSSMWCFGSMRMFLNRRDEFAAWKMSQDVVIRKHLPTSFTRDRFRRRHDLVIHWYRGRWSDIHHDLPSLPHDGPSQARVAKGGKQAGVHGAAGNRGYTDTRLRLATSVMEAKSSRTAPGAGGRSIHPTQKCVTALTSLIEYACPPGGTVLDPFAGSGSTGEAAQLTGRHAVLIEADERYCEVIARRLGQGFLAFEGSVTSGA